MNKKIAKIFQGLTYWPAFLFLKLFFSWEIEGQENLKGLEDKSILVDDIKNDRGKAVDSGRNEETVSIPSLQGVKRHDLIRRVKTTS